MRRACEGGIAQACFGVGEAYRTGRGGMAQDLSSAAPFYERACDRGVPPACAHLGFMYKTGQGVPFDADRAAALLRRACDARDEWACQLLREMNR
jgi:hypothetical protein